MGQVMGKITQNYMTPKVLTHLESMPPVTKLIYTMKHKYAGYPFCGSLEVQKMTLNGFIKYIEKSQDSKGFDFFFQALIKDAKATECRYIRVEFDQCSKPMVQKLEKYSKKHEFECDEISTFGDTEAVNKAGPNIQIYKEFKS